MSAMRIIVALALSAATPLYAVSGLGVAIVAAGGTSSMRVYKVADNHVDTSYNLVDSWPAFGNNGFPVAINSHGTHVAVVHWSGNMDDNDQRISIIRLSDPSKTVDVVFHGGDGGNAWGSKQICWPQGDWIYFNTANKSKYLYRVNAQTRDIEFIAHINLNQENDPNGNYGAELKMSSINFRMMLTGGLYFTLQELQNSPNGVLNTNGWPNGAFLIQGCGHTISASGNVAGNQVDPGHCLRIISTLDWETKEMTASSLYSARDRNRMSVDIDDPFLACTPAFDPCTGTDSTFIETIGVGQTTMGNSFAVNSDKWECLVSGWFPDGRELGNGGNFILFNPFDSISLNVTRLPRKEANQISGSCSVDPGNSGFAVHPSFFVTEPVEDIIPELRADATSGYSVPGLDDNTQFPELVKMPPTPDGGWPIIPVSAEMQPARSNNKGMPVTFEGGGASGVRIAFQTQDRHTVKVFDSKGALVAARSGNQLIEIFGRHNGLHRGIYVFHISGNGCSTARTVSIL